MSTAVYRGGCFCGAVSYQVTGPPILSAYCHCTVCQRLTGCPFIHTIHFPGPAFVWRHEPIDTALDAFVSPAKPWKTRYRCKGCGASVASMNSKANRWSIWGAQLERDEDGKLKFTDVLKPTAHIFYETRMLDVADGLGKWAGYANESKRL